MWEFGLFRGRNYPRMRQRFENLFMILRPALRWAQQRQSLSRLPHRFPKHAAEQYRPNKQEHGLTNDTYRHFLSYPGPKPGAGPSSTSPGYARHGRQRRWLFWSLLILSLQITWGAGEWRVEAHTSGVSETGESLSGTHALPREGAGAARHIEARPSTALVYPWSAKRAYRRARARAAHGPTMYRGKLCTPSELQAQYGQPVSQRISRPVRQVHSGSRDRPQTEARHPTRRVDVLTFNVSGWQELQAIASVSLWGGCSQLLFCVSYRPRFET